MKLKGKIKESSVVVLIDWGATHNFLSQKVIETLQYATIVTSNYGVVMGTGVAVKGKGVCKGVVLKLLEIPVIENFLPLELGGKMLSWGCNGCARWDLWRWIGGC